MEPADRVTVVTGAASGIGEAIAEAFVTGGAKTVVVADRDGPGAERVAERLGPAAHGVQLDVADEDAIRALVAETEAAHGPIDVFVSNAGYGLAGGLDLPNDEWTRMMDVHVWSHLYAARAVVPGMVERGEGYLLNTASAAGLLTQMDSGPYAVSKHAAVALAEWLSINYGDRGVKVSVLCPQAVRTNILGDRANMGSDASTRQAGGDGVLEPAEAAQACLDAMREERFLVLPHPQVGHLLRTQGQRLTTAGWRVCVASDGASREASRRIWPELAAQQLEAHRRHPAWGLTVGGEQLVKRSIQLGYGPSGQFPLGVGDRPFVLQLSPRLLRGGERLCCGSHVGRTMTLAAHRPALGSRRHRGTGRRLQARPGPRPTCLGRASRPPRTGSPGPPRW